VIGQSLFAPPLYEERAYVAPDDQTGAGGCTPPAESKCIVFGLAQRPVRFGVAHGDAVG
jgi:hypothetical protein